MKRIAYMLLCLLFTLTVKAQFVYNDEGGIVPFSLTEKYKNVINISTVKTCMLKSYNNDSLDISKNKNNNSDFKISGDFKIAGISIDTLIDLKTVATRYKIDEGTLWIYRIESKTAEMLGITINPLVIPEGAYICIFPKKEEFETRGPKLFLKKDIISSNFSKNHYGNQLYVEYFEPNKVDKEANINISKIHYMFLSPFKKKVETETAKENTNGQLKSGFYGTATNTCQYNVVCPDVSYWAKEARSIVYISAVFQLPDGSWAFTKGTGFFINKSGNYSDTDKPYLLTAGHTFAIWDLANNICYDKTQSSLVDFEFRVNYRDETCNDPVERRGQMIPDFNIITKGSSYNKKAMDPTYEENEDYILLKSSTATINDLKNYNVLYAGWNAFPTYSNSGYAAIGHPGGDVQKVLVESGRGQIPSSGKSVSFYFDKGVAEGGFSGAPVFDNQKRVVGMICTTQPGNCQSVGQNLYATFCCNFGQLFWNSISQYLAPGGQTLQEGLDPAPPIPPSHCKNCIQDLGETSVDCGGTCLPCGLKDFLSLTSNADIVKNEISARYELVAEPDPSSQLEFSSGNFNLTAGNNIRFNNNVVINQGVSLKAAVIPALMSTPPRGCQSPCVNPMPAFTPNGDGVNDYWSFIQAFVSSYSLSVYNRWGGTAIYTKSNTQVYENGIVRAWNGTGVSSNGTYQVVLTITDCHGTTLPAYVYYISISGLKSLNLNELQAELPKSNVKTDDDKTFKITAYPNPTSGKVSVEATDSDLLFDYILTDMTGKMLVEATDVLGSGDVDLSAFPSGLYLLQVKSGENIQLCKLIKK